MRSDEDYRPVQPLAGPVYGPPADEPLTVRPHGEAGGWTPAEYGHLCYRLGRLEALVDVVAADLRALRERVAR